MEAIVIQKDIVNIVRKIIVIKLVQKVIVLYAVIRVHIIQMESARMYTVQV